MLVVALAACGSSSPPAANHTGQGVGADTSRSATTATTAPLPQESSFSPYTPQGAVSQGLHVVQKVSGQCTSPGVAGTTSYRCTAQPGAMTYDPCFAAPGTSTGALLCVPYPTDADVTAFNVKTLPAPSSQAAPSRIWAMQLQNGEVCVLVRATWHGSGPFACVTPSATSSVADCHTPEHTAHGWIAACQVAQDANSAFTNQPVASVWN